MTGKMTAMFHSLLLVSVFFISCRADEAGTQAQVDKSQDAETKSDVWADHSTTTVKSQLSQIKILISILLQDVQDVQLGQNDIVSRLEEMEEKLTENQPAGQADCMKCLIDTHCKNDTNDPIHKVYKDCQAAYDAGERTSGVYTIRPDGVMKVQVYCEQEIEGGGWTVFQSRIDGTVDFFRDWHDYKFGFGNAQGEFWLGNHHIYHLTRSHDQKLRVELKNGADAAFTTYSSFSINDENDKYKMQVGGYDGSSTAGDSLTQQTGRYFSTKDRDSDTWHGNCAEWASGAWWYTACYHANLNGLYNSPSSNKKGVVWHSWKGFTPLSGSRMMLKRN